MVPANSLTFREAATWLESLADRLAAGDEAADLDPERFQQIANLLTSDRCLANLKPGEPCFILRGQDQTAPGVVKFWLSLGENLGVRLPAERIAEVANIVQAMEAYEPRKLPD